MADFVANFDLDINEFEADFELQNTQFDALFEINPTGASWGSITGTLANQTDLKNELDTLSGQIDSNHQAITEINTTIQGYGDIVTYNASDFATSIQGGLADTALQPNDNISELVNDVGYITSASLPTVNNSTITIQKNNTTIDSFTLNQNTNKSINITVPTQASDINAVPTSRTINGKALSSNITLSASDVGALADSTTINDLTTTAQQNALNSGATSTNIGQIATNTSNINSLSDTVTNNYNTLDGRITSEVSALNTAIGLETTNRQNADNALQSQIDAIVSSSDVFDIVGTYAELQAYDISTVPVNDIIKVLVDSTHNNSATYYRCTETNNVKSWTYIGAEGAYYTKSEADNLFVEQTTTINNKPLSNNITLTASDVGALPSSTVIGSGVLTIQKNGSDVDTFSANASTNKSINITVPTKTSDLTNDSNFATVSQIPTNNNQLTNGAGYITISALDGYATENFVTSQGYITGITSSDVTTALGYNPVSDTAMATALSSKQDTLVSGTNIKTINNESLLGSGDISLVTSSTLTTTLQDYVLSSSLATVATSGSYNDLLNKPTIPSAQVNSDWNATSGVAEILNKPNLATVATSGSYNDLSNKPIIPSEVTESTVSGWGFTKNEGTVTSVNNTQPDVNGNVTIQTGGTVDDSFSTTSENPLQNKVITNALMDVTTGSYYVYGSPTISNNIISNMSNSDYILTDYVYNCTSSDTWRLTVWIETFDYVNNPIVFSNSIDGTKSIEVGFSQEKLYVKLSSDGSTWDIADTTVSGTNFFGGQMAFELRYNSNYIDIFTYNGNYYSQYTSYQGTPYNTNSQMKIYNSVSTNTTTIDLSKSSMVVNNSTVWDGADGAIAYTPKFQEKLVSGTNIKTINNTSLLGSGDISLVTTDTAQTISGRKTFTGEKAIYFKQDATTNKLGFTLYNPSDTELGAFEYRPNTINTINALLNINTEYSNRCYVGLRYWGTQNINIVAPKPTTAGDYYIPVNITDGTNTVTANNTGTVNISTLLPNTTNFEQTSNKVTSLSSSSTDTQYPSAKCVYDELADAVKHETTDTVTLYAWYNQSITPDTIYTTTTNAGKVSCFDSNGKFLMNGNIITTDLVTSLGTYNRASASDTTFIRSTLTDNNSNVLNIVQADGQWVGSYLQISTAKATGTYDIDLSSYLPNDNYNYEVYFFAHMYSSNSTYSKVYVKTSILSTAGETSGIRVGYVGANSRQGVVNTILPIGADRILTIEITGRTLDGSDTGFCLAGYRRIGTNS